MWATPRKATLALSPLNAMTLVCAGHQANHHSAELRNLGYHSFSQWCETTSQVKLKKEAPSFHRSLLVSSLKTQHLVAFQQNFW